MASKQAISAKNVGSQKTAQKPIVKFDDGLFLRGLVGALKTHSNLTEDSSIDDINAAVEEVKELWLITKEYAENGGFSTAIEAIQDITTYIIDNNYVYERPVLYTANSFSVELSVPTKIPGVNATFSLHCTPSGTDFDAALIAAYDYLKAFASANFKPTNQPMQSTTKSAADSPEEEEFEFSVLRALVFNGKLIHRLMPLEGKWVQFGIPLYGDEARKAGIDLSEYPEPGDYELVGSATVQYKPDGKPMRAKSIEV